MDESKTRSETGANNGQASESKPLYQARPPRNQRTSRELTDAQASLKRPKDDEQQQQQQQQTQQSGKSENSSNGDDEPRRLSLAELFANDGDEDHQNSNGSGGDDPSKPPDTVERAVKRLGLKDPKDFYAIKVPMPDGAEPLTIGELKDRVGELVDFETRELQSTHRLRERESELLRSQAEMREMMALIPRDKLTPEVLEKARKKHEATLRVERAATLEHIPDWQDDKRRLEDITGMIELLEGYGFNENFIETIVDHRAMKLLRDFYLMDRKIKAALAKVKDLSRGKSGHRPSVKTGKGATKPNQHERSRPAPMPDNRARIAALFNSFGNGD